MEYNIIYYYSNNDTPIIHKSFFLENIAYFEKRGGSVVFTLGLLTLQDTIRGGP